MAKGRGSRASNGSTASERHTSPSASSNGVGASTSQQGVAEVTDPSSIASSSRDPFSYHTVSLAPTDALPYYDRELELQPGLRARVDALITAEQSTLPPLDSTRLPPAYELFRGRPDLRAELDRVSSGQPSRALDTQRYTLPAPTDGDSASIEEWQRAVDSAYAQLGHMDVRLKNIELLKRFGPNAWRLSNFNQEQQIRTLSEELERVKAETNEVNRIRQKDQTEAGAKLAGMEKRWTDHIGRGLQLEVANVTIREEVEVLRGKKRRLEGVLAEME
ncbi:Pre-mRNA-splicing factor SPF27 [Kalmanozyma brasiliensis GHG001]|uniref:Pre-mRNA-splicing factor SPF27 n=1 Tax=Kalmanozyma brasiliensis (strain GHG001) TaxID=1365824 RepID=UPI0028680EAC|nr:Pre-mRNA-splicing factor SPF27 [Kalmanozyma brasiliensis GHG001]KAF6767123.1 Pre-mRNA-splicing factor SPF27 [Kalmanozyma brasiliensis GHG001]